MGTKSLFTIIEAILFLDKCSFLKEIKKTYIFMITYLLSQTLLFLVFSLTRLLDFLVLVIPLLNAAELQVLRVFYWQFFLFLWN